MNRTSATTAPPPSRSGGEASFALPPADGAVDDVILQPNASLDVSIILPCLNEESTVGPCIDSALAWLADARLRGEVIVVDNGSSDESAAVAVAHGARVVAEPRRGKGRAVQSGIDACLGEVILLADADGTYDLSRLNDFVAPLRDGCDMVIGNRLRGTMEPGAMPWLHRYVGNPLFSLVISLITRRHFGDVLSGIRSARREVWQQIAARSGGFELESEICLRAGRLRLNVLEVPVDYAARATSSKLRALNHGWAIIKFIVLESADILFIYPALLAIATGIIALAIGAASSHGVPVGTVRWQPVFAGGILIPGGIALLTLGVLASWLSWRQGLTEPSWAIRLVNSKALPTFELLLALGLVFLVTGLLLDSYLLIGWATNNPRTNALGLGAISQTLVVSALNLIVAAMLFEILTAKASD